MSVINKMLRDLDQRQATRSVAPGPNTGIAGVGTTALPLGKPASSGAGSRRVIWLVVVVSVLAVAAGGVFWWQNGGMPTVEPAVVVVAPVAAPVLAAASQAASEPAVVTATPDTVVPAAANETMVLRMESSLSARRALDALLSSTPTPAPATVAAATPATPAAPASERPKVRNAASAPVAVPAPATAVAGPAAASRESAPVLQRQQLAGVDAVAQAQSLWNTGSREAALELMQQSIAVAERTARAPGSNGANPVLLPLVREMARMQLAEARYGAVWEMLTRLESQLGNQPDLWAIRANAAQRLGRHPDSVHAYMMALQSRPDEQRWLLGTAVSLAALGQTASAAEMAEKARAVGPVSKEILAYLRQAGVSLRE